MKNVTFLMFVVLLIFGAVSASGSKHYDFDDEDRLPLVCEATTSGSADSVEVEIIGISCIPMENCNSNITETLKKKTKVSGPGKGVVSLFCSVEGFEKENYFFNISQERYRKQHITSFLFPNGELAQPRNLDQEVFQMGDSLLVFFRELDSDVLFPVVTGKAGYDKLLRFHNLKFEIVQFNADMNIISSKKSSFPVMAWGEIDFHPEFLPETEYVYLKVVYPVKQIKLQEEYIEDDSDQLTMFTQL